MEDIKINVATFLIPLLIINITPLASSQSHISNFWCESRTGNYSKDSTYENSLNDLFPILINQASLTNFGNASIGEGIDKVYMLYSCRGDLDSRQCHSCIKEATQSITEKCSTYKEAIVWAQECMIRYANHSIFSFEDESYYSYDFSDGNDPNPQLGEIVADNLEGLIEQAAYNQSTKGYVTGQVNIGVHDDIYLLVQCTPDILGSRCERCLRAALRSMAGCCGTKKSTMLYFYPSCHIRYERAPFILNDGVTYTNTLEFPSFISSLESTPPNDDTGGSTSRMLISYGTISMFGLMTAVGVLFNVPSF